MKLKPQMIPERRPDIVGHMSLETIGKLDVLIFDLLHNVYLYEKLQRSLCDKYIIVQDAHYYRKRQLWWKYG